VEIKGINGQIEFDGQSITIRRKGFMARTGVGKGEKRIPLRHVTSVQFKPAGPVVNGFIQFSLGGGNERRSAFGQQTMDAAKDENSVVFRKKQQPGFEELRAAVESAMVVDTPAAGPAALDRPTQLQKLADLHSSGVLNDAEFEQEKHRLLNS
jgi:Domain of unknown function (DUF4429)/Short C-terminal domain